MTLVFITWLLLLLELHLLLIKLMILSLWWQELLLLGLWRSQLLLLLRQLESCAAGEIWWLVRSFLVALCCVCHEVRAVREPITWVLRLCKLWIHGHVRWFGKILSYLILHRFVLLRNLFCILGYTFVLVWSWVGFSLLVLLMAYLILHAMSFGLM